MQADKLVLKKPRGDQSSPLAHNYLSFNKVINVLSEVARCKQGHTKIDWMKPRHNEGEKVNICRGKAVGASV